MPVVITDKTNKVWAVEDPMSGFIVAGYTGQRGPRLLDLLDFVEIRKKQFLSFVEKQKKGKLKNEQGSTKIITKSTNLQFPKN